jgi:hypothetical protein
MGMTSRFEADRHGELTSTSPICSTKHFAVTGSMVEAP